MPFNFNPGLFNLPNTMFGDSMDVTAQADPIMQDVNLSDTSLPDNNRVPFDALSAMMGVNLPSLPSRDAYGNYGITPEQDQHAGKQAFMSVLGDAGSMFLGGSPMIGTQTGQKASGIYDAALGKASALNVADYKLKVEAAQNEINRIAKLSDAERQQLLIENETMKLNELKSTQRVAQVWLEEMKSEVPGWMSEAEKLDADLVAKGFAPRYKKELLGGLYQAEAAVLKGDLLAADNALESGIQNLPDVLQAKIKMDLFNATAKKSANFQLQEAITPGLEKLGGPGSKVEYDANGNAVLLTEQDLRERDARLRTLQAEALWRESLAAKEQSLAQLGGAMKPKEIAAATQKVFEAANTIATTTITTMMPQAERAKAQDKLNKAAAILQAHNFEATPESANAIINGGQEAVRQRIIQSLTNQAWMLNSGVGMPMQYGSAPPPQQSAGVTFAAARGLAARTVNDPTEAARLLQQIATSTDPLIRQALAGIHGWTGNPVTDLALAKQALNPAQ